MPAVSVVRITPRPGTRCGRGPPCWRSSSWPRGRASSSAWPRAAGPARGRASARVQAGPAAGGLPGTGGGAGGTTGATGQPRRPPAGPQPSQHRLRPHRRPLDGPAALHAPGPGTPDRRDDVQQLLRVGLAVLPVALVDLHRGVPARHRRVHQLRPLRRAQRVLQPRRRGPHVQHRAAARGLPHRDDGQVHQRLPQGPRRSPIPSTGVPPGWSEWDVAGWGYREFDYELNIDGTLHYFGARPAGLPHGRDRPAGRALHQPLGRDGQAVLPGARHLRAAHPVRPRAA